MKLKNILFIILTFGVFVIFGFFFKILESAPSKYVIPVTEQTWKNMTLYDKPVLPKLLEGDVNMPEVMYHSVVLLKKVYNQEKLHLGINKKYCGHPTVCSAFDILTKAFGKKVLNLDYYIFQLNILRHRHLARHPRPVSCKGCFAYNFSTILSPRDICAKTDKPIDLFLLITTVPKAADARSALRDTWLQYTDQNRGNIRYLFLIGGGWPDDLMMQVKEENQKFGDILVENYHDSYFNLSYKVLSGFRWAVKHCPDATFVSRSADDIYLNVPKTMEYLAKNKANMTDTVIGTCYPTAIIDRKGWTRHFQTKKDFQASYFGPFCVGKTLIMPMGATKKIVQVSPDIPWFNLEDHWVGFAGEKAKLKVRMVKGFNIEYYPNENIALYFEWRKKQGVCNFSKDWYNLHRTTPSDIRAVYKQCINTTATVTTSLLKQ